MDHDLDKILSLTFSGIRPGEEAEVIGLIEACGLRAADLGSAALRNFLVARKGGRICGTAGLQIAAGSALLRALFVAENERRKGIGARLIEAVARYAKTRKVTRLYLLTLNGRDYFAGLGFTPVGPESMPDAIRTSPEFERLARDNAVCMVRKLGE